MGQSRGAQSQVTTDALVGVGSTVEGLGAGDPQPASTAIASANPPLRNMGLKCAPAPDQRSERHPPANSAQWVVPNEPWQTRHERR